MSSGNTKTSNSHRLLHNLSDKTNLKRGEKYVALSSLRAYAIHYTWKDFKFKISGPAWNEKFGLPDGSYSVSDI